MANAVTVGRLILLFVAVYVLYRGSVTAIGIAAIAIGIAIILDGLDGWVARRYNETGPLGAAFDIAGDRIAENVLWVVYADLGLIPIWVPLLMLTRGFLVDSIRAIGYGEGKTPFGKDNMMRSAITEWLTAGRPMRLLYGWAKLLAFVFLGGLVGYQLHDASGTLLGDLYGWDPFRYFGWACVWVSVVLSIVRGLPVLYDAFLTYGPQAGRNSTAE
ncbi:MAG: CDP-alcohol phosphatidyltransferase family protein [Thermomicrobiales bacterium]|nr:CDP-alcohol phosphatidyltransferase family protein [Thermomicrobiales bacterium]MCO5221173.1 CDP-alcohol phosphatidyltransferase family protein [Thermomicrobiales bacterium]